MIIIRSLVPGGAAQLDGRLVPGDRLVGVNDISLANATLEQAVQALKGTPVGPVEVRILKPLPGLDPDDASNPDSVNSFFHSFIQKFIPFKVTTQKRSQRQCGQKGMFSNYLEMYGYVI